MSDLAERMNQALHTMRATEGTPYFSRACAAMAALVEFARRGRH